MIIKGEKRHFGDIFKLELLLRENILLSQALNRDVCVYPCAHVHVHANVGWGHVHLLWHKRKQRVIWGAGMSPLLLEMGSLACCCIWQANWHTLIGVSSLSFLFYRGNTGIVDICSMSRFCKDSGNLNSGVYACNANALST